ncbi:YIP1 family protein [Paracoccus sp. S-4012]|uniref:YIP1 family protein n=1 Tax=Paracoccus sp. S-4012 TaxID=2665648 RepID=UPI0012AFCCE2|nr:YIP1 family protein [Paracoccus sp. S-4012]MRX49570.1 YIP1 family protein [Paracoccus sp. S-4012]
MSFAQGWQLLQLSLKAPDAALAALRGLGLTMGERWMALALMAALSTLLAWAAEAMFPIEVAGPMSILSQAPLMLAAMQFAAAAFGAALVTMVGRAFGGTGSFADAVLVIAWIEAVIVALQAAQLVLTLLFPFVAAVLTLVAFAVYVMLLVRLVTALHGFQNPFFVGLAMLGTLLLAGTVLGALLGGLGLAPVPEVAP